MSCSDDDPKLPQVLVEEILKRLPVRDLLRFRCVSKMWRSTVDDPRFVALHLSHSKWYVAGLYSLYPDRERVDREKERKLYSLFPSERPSLSPIEIPFASRRNHYGIVGSSNGLICVKEIPQYRYGQTMYLWNLFTRKHKAVPLPGPEYGFLFTESARLVSGFCFDARSNDYKIVSFLCNKSRLPGVKPPKPPVAIYSLRTGCWRSLECEVPAFSNHKPAVFLNGNLHWPGYTHVDQRKETMVLFDVVGEVFDEMAFPQEVSLVNSVGFAEWCVAVLDDSLAVLIAREDGHPELLSFCSVWVMEEYGKPESWTWRYSFRACGLVTDVDGITRNGEHLMQIEEDRGFLESEHWAFHISSISEALRSGQCGRKPRFILEMTRLLLDSACRRVERDI